MDWDELRRRDLRALIDLDEFAITAIVDGVPVNGVFSRGMSGDREPRSPELRVLEQDIAPFQHGAEVLIDFSEFDTEFEGIVTYYLQGYKPDGHGTARLILETEMSLTPTFSARGQPLQHGRPVDSVDAYLFQIGLTIDSARHGRGLGEPSLLVQLLAIDAELDNVTKAGQVVSGIVAVDGKAYAVQGGNGVLHAADESPTQRPVYSFDGSLGSYLLSALTYNAQQPFTAFVVTKRDAGVDQTLFDNQ